MKRYLFFIICLASGLSLLASPSVRVYRTSVAMADQYGWAHDGKPGSILFNDVISLTNEQPANNCKYDANNKGVRFYQQCGYFTLQAREGAVIQSIKLSYLSANNTYGTLATRFGEDGYNIPVADRIVSDQSYEVNASSIRLWTGSTVAKATDGSTANRGTIRILSWEIVYYDSLSVVDSYQALDTESSGDEVTFIGDRGLYSWKVKNFQHKVTDKGDYINGDFGIRIRYDGSKSEGYLAMNGNQEGGIKAISFDYHSTGDNMPIHLLIKEGSTTIDDYQHASASSTSNVFGYSKELNLKSNTAISIVNPKLESPQQTYVVVGPITVTPYLLFTTHRDSISLSAASGTYNLSPILINNTGEVPLFTVERNTTGATVDVQGGAVSLAGITQSGEIDIKASWNDGAVFTTMTLKVEKLSEPSTGERLTETFSRCTETKMYDGRVHVVGDNSIYDWSIKNFQRVPEEDKVGDAQGIRVRYNGSIAMTSAQEGGIKEVIFDWRVSGNEMPIHYYVRVNNKEYEVRQSGVSSSEVMHYFQMVDMKQNAQLIISVPAEEDPAQTYVIVGPITIVPYVLFKVPNRIDSVDVTEVTTYDLSKVMIDNTESEGEIVYEIVSDETGAATIDGSEIDLSKVEQSGLVAVKATWGEVTTTMSLWVIGANPSGLVQPTANSFVQPFVKTMKDGQFYIYRGEECYSILGNQIQ